MNHCYGTLYDVSTVCVLQKVSDYKKRSYERQLERLNDILRNHGHPPQRSRYLN